MKRIQGQGFLPKAETEENKTPLLLRLFPGQSQEGKPPEVRRRPHSAGVVHLELPLPQQGASDGRWGHQAALRKRHAEGFLLGSHTHFTFSFYIDFKGAAK